MYKRDYDRHSHSGHKVGQYQICSDARGIPIQLITAGLMAMGLMGFYGLYLG